MKNVLLRNGGTCDGSDLLTESKHDIDERQDRIVYLNIATPNIIFLAFRDLVKSSTVVRYEWMEMIKKEKAIIRYDLKSNLHVKN